MTKTRLKDKLKWCLAPTLYISDTYKMRAISLKDRGRRVRRLNKIYLTISILLYIIVNLMCIQLKDTVWEKTLLIFIPIWTLSRANEIFMAFIKDVFDKLDLKRRTKNGLEYYERIYMALRSFVELTIHYAILYFLLDTYYIQYGFKASLFNQGLEEPFTALYFSLMTIASIGYGDYYPVHPLSRGLVMYEVITGFLLLAVSFTVYVGLNLDEEEAP